MNVIDFRDARPIYEQIAAHYERLILAGVLETDEQLPSVRSLSVELSTNPNTVQKAFSRLEHDGYIYSVKGRGNFVKGKEDLVSMKKEEIVSQIAKLLKEAGEMGISISDLIEEAKERVNHDRD